MTDAQMLRELADLLDRAFPERADTTRLRTIAAKVEASNRVEHAMAAIIDELIYAEKKWPGWPVDPIHAAGVMAEEAGECVRAANRFYYESKSLMEVCKEAAQTGAMAIRMLMGMDQYVRKPVQDMKPDGLCDACTFWLGEGYDKCGVCGRAL